MSEAASPNPNGNPFDVPLNSEIQESQQRQAASQAASDNGNPFDEPLASEVAEQKAANINPSLTGTARQYAANAGGVDIKPVTKSTNPKLAMAMSGADEPEYAGAVGAAGAGAMAASPIADSVVTAVVSHLGKVKAILDAAGKLGLTSGGIGFGIKEARDLYKEFSGGGK